jgi:hypothetical protein
MPIAELEYPETRGVRKKVALAGLGNLYQYKLYDYPFLGPRTYKGTRYVVWAKDKAGNYKAFKANTKEAAVAAFRAAKGQGYTDVQVNWQEVASQLEEKEGLLGRYLAEEPVDYGPAEFSNPVTDPFNDFVQGIKNWFESLKHVWEIR